MKKIDRAAIRPALALLAGGVLSVMAGVPMAAPAQAIPVAA